MSGSAATLRRQGSDRRGRHWLIRPTTADDATALVALRDAVAAERRWVAAAPGDRTDLEERLAIASLVNGGGLALTMEVEGSLAGQLSVARLRAPYQAHIGELSIALGEPYRDAGLGSELVGVAVDWARLAGVRRLQLGVFPDNARAIAVYRHHGFVDEGVERMAVRVGGEERDILRMAAIV